MSQAIDAYYTIAASPEFQETERLRAKARHDEAQALYHAENTGRAKGRVEGRVEGKTEVARNLLSEGDPMERIIRITGLTREEIESLRDAN